MLQLKFTRHLQPQHVVEQDYATFECEVTRGRIPVDWYHNDVKIIPNPKYQVVYGCLVHHMYSRYDYSGTILVVVL